LLSTGVMTELSAVAGVITVGVAERVCS